MGIESVNKKLKTKKDRVKIITCYNMRAYKIQTVIFSLIAGFKLSKKGDNSTYNKMYGLWPFKRSTDCLLCNQVRKNNEMSIFICLL